MRSTHTFVLHTENGDCHFDISPSEDSPSIAVYQFNHSGGIAWQAVLAFDDIRELAHEAARTTIRE